MPGSGELLGPAFLSSLNRKRAETIVPAPLDYRVCITDLELTKRVCSTETPSGEFFINWVLLFKEGQRILGYLSEPAFAAWSFDRLWIVEGVPLPIIHL